MPTSPRAKASFPCPDCGKEIEVPSGVSGFACRHCGQALLLFPGNRIVLANPLQTYIGLDEQDGDLGAKRDSRASAKPTVSQISNTRKERAAELALGRIVREKKYALRGVFCGLFTSLCGGLLFLLAFLRSLFVAEDWLNLIGFSFGLVFIPLGVLIAIWFFLAIRSWNKEEAEIKKEI